MAGLGSDALTSIGLFFPVFMVIIYVCHGSGVRIKYYFRPSVYFKMEMGVVGAAWATLLSICVSSGLMSFWFLSKGIPMWISALFLLNLI